MSSADETNQSNLKPKLLSSSLDLCSTKFEIWLRCIFILKRTLKTRVLVDFRLQIIHRPLHVVLTGSLTEYNCAKSSHQQLIKSLFIYFKVKDCKNSRFITFKTTFEMIGNATKESCFSNLLFSLPVKQFKMYQILRVSTICNVSSSCKVFIPEKLTWCVLPRQCILQQESLCASCIFRLLNLTPFSYIFQHVIILSYKSPNLHKTRIVLLLI